jgi:amidase
MVANDLKLGETTNNIVGSTVNPYNSDFSAGGACGGTSVKAMDCNAALTRSTGEGALIALKGSPLGLATDMGKTNRTHLSLLLVTDREQLDRLASPLRSVGCMG